MACFRFMEHLYWHKPRLTLLRPKIEGLPDGHLFKPRCLRGLSQLFEMVGNLAEEKRLLTHALSLWRKRWNYPRVCQTLWYLSDVNRRLGLYREGIQQAEEVLKICKWIRFRHGQVNSLRLLAELWLGTGQLDAAENAALRTIDLLPKEGQEFLLCKSHRVLGNIYDRKGEKEKAFVHHETALRISSTFGWQDMLFCNHYDLANLFLNEHEFGDANTHVEQAKSHTVDNMHNIGLAMELQAWIWYRQCRLEDARREASGALEIFEKLGAAQGVEKCSRVLQEIERATESHATSGESASGEQSGHGAPSHRR